MKMLLPIILLVLGVGGGIGAGLFLMPNEPEITHADTACGDLPPPAEEHAEDTHTEEPVDPNTELEGREYARLSNQFVVPVVRDGTVGSLVVLSLSIEVPEGGKDNVFVHEPKLRDGFLQVLFNHANEGGFNGAFTSATNMRILRNSLRDAAHDIMGNNITDVLIIDIVRQDV
jgi:hypothetical protein